MAPKKSKKRKEPEAPVADEELEIIEMIDPEEQFEKGGNVPALIHQVSDKVRMRANELCAEWRITGSQALWRMCCLIEMQNQESMMEPLCGMDLAYMGQVVWSRAISFSCHLAFYLIFLQNGVQLCDRASCFEVPMGSTKVFRYFSAFGVPWDDKQNLQDIHACFQSAWTLQKIQLLTGHMVKIPIGNGRVRKEPWLIRCFRHGNVQDVAE
jgi:hypothetical protein